MPFPGSQEASMFIQPVASDDAPIDLKVLDAVVEKLRPVLLAAVAEGINGLSLLTLASPQAEVGVELTEKTRQKAKVVKEELLNSKHILDDRLLIDVDTVAHLLSVSSGTVYRLAYRGEMPPPVKMQGRMVRWRADELKAWVDADCPVVKTWRWPKPPPLPLPARR
jgi:excisionase family DNA binding protein